jgi:transmembrane sensor
MPTPEDESALWSRLARYVAGESDANEVAAVREWVLEDPAHETILAEVMSGWERARITPATVDAPRAWQALTGRMSEPAQRPARASVTPVRARFTWPLALAASFVIAMLGATLAWPRLHGGATVYASAAGTRRTVTLPDGTIITLAPGSSLRVPREYGTASREVTLDGEGYFTVRHDARLPFAVQSGALRTTDVGTAFDIRAYSTDTAIRIVVTEGRVAVRSDERSPAVTASVGEMIETPAACGTCAPGAARRADVQTALAWMHGRLAVHDVPLFRLAPELARWYGLDVSFSDSALSHRLVTANWSTEAPDQVLRELGGLLQARVVRDGARVRLDPLR